MATGWKPVALSAMHREHLRLGAVMGLEAGWRRPTRYTLAEDEMDRVRRLAGICDVSPSGKLVIHSDDIYGTVASIMGGDGLPAVGRAADGRVGPRDDAEAVLMVRLARDEMWMITAPGAATLVLGVLDEQLEGCAHPVDVTSALAGVKIAGPLAWRLLSGLTELDVSPERFSDMSCAQAKVAEVHGTVVRRDLPRLPSYDLYFGREFGGYMWHALLEAGASLGVTPFGTDALGHFKHRGHGEHGEHRE